MGRKGSDPRINHFSHRHSLELVSLEQSPQLTPPTCAGCTFRSSGRVYSCQPCGYVLHLSCAEMPRRIRHPAHPDHSLTLLPVPAYKEGSFRCGACGRDGAGFSYHCESCSGGGIDFHLLCAAMPLSVSHASHEHQLGLVFAAPYEDGGFSCDLCGCAGANHWLYRCATCEFDAHIGCATAKSLVLAAEQPRELPPQQQAPPQQPPQLPPQIPAQLTPPQQAIHRWLQPPPPQLPQQTTQRRPQQPMMWQLAAQGSGPMGVGMMAVNNGAWRGHPASAVGMQQRQSNPVAVGGMQQQEVMMMNGTGRGIGGGGLIDGMIKNLVNSTTQQMGQVLVQNMFGGGGGGGVSGGGGDGGTSIIDAAASI